MQDEFLKQFREDPQTEFSQKLYHRLQTRERRSKIMTRTLLAVITVIILFSLSVFTIPAVRAAAINLIQEIGGLNFIITAQAPEVEPRQEAQKPAVNLALDQVAANFSGPLMLPRDVPAGFELQPLVSYNQISTESLDIEMVRFRWSKIEVTYDEHGNLLENEVFIHLEMQYTGDENKLPDYLIGQDAVEEVALPTGEAVLIRGAWDPQTRLFQDSPLLQLVWKVEEHTVYTLSASADHVQAADLVAIAASISPE